MSGTHFFISTVTFGNNTVDSTQGHHTKKEAEQAAAREALVKLGIENPDELAAKQKGKGKEMAKLIKLKPHFDQM